MLTCFRKKSRQRTADQNYQQAPDRAAFASSKKRSGNSNQNIAA
tara:strand:+ start:3071 stop:3202 length:132 start_codon:yes stop_codon:yes gene_type:complete